MHRRYLLKLCGSAAAATMLPAINKAGVATEKGPFRFCLNTSTIMGQKPGLLRAIEIAAKTGYDGMELWINDIKDYLKQGNSIQSLAKFISTKGIVVESVISFTQWMADDDNKRNAALAELEEEMKMMAVLGCHRIAAPPAGVDKDKCLDFQKAGARYREILALGRKYKVMPQLEFWGASGTLYNLS